VKYQSYVESTKRKKIARGPSESCDMIEDHHWELYKSYLKYKNTCLSLQNDVSESVKAKDEKENELQAAKQEVCSSLS
jgi:hypothetical protein